MGILTCAMDTKGEHDEAKVSAAVSLERWWRRKGAGAAVSLPEALPAAVTDQNSGEGKYLAPYNPSEQIVIDKFLELAGVTSSDIIYDLGCGDGRVVIGAAGQAGACGVGVEYNCNIAKKAATGVDEANLSDRVKILHQD